MTKSITHPNDDNEANCLICRYYSLGRVSKFIEKERTDIIKHLTKQGFNISVLKKEDKK